MKSGHQFVFVSEKVLCTYYGCSELALPPTPKHSPGAATDNAVVIKIKIPGVIFLKPLYFNRCTRYLKSHLEQ
jgi:hypothetical protein